MPPQPWPDARPETMLSVGLEAWALACPLPLVLFFDEVDALRGKSLLSFLAQVREGFAARPYAFPKSVVLCGPRDVRDYRIASGKDPEVIGSSSPFNVSVKSYRLANFIPEEVAELYGQPRSSTCHLSRPTCHPCACGHNVPNPDRTNRGEVTSGAGERHRHLAHSKGATLPRYAAIPIPNSH
jgi:hypothetical protein